MKPDLLLLLPLFLITSTPELFSQTSPNINPQKNTAMAALIETDEKTLSEMNAKFIRNFVTMDTGSHNQIIHENFICINGDGSISNRKTYMDAWANAYTNSGYTSFSYTDESIRIFGDVALVSSKTVYTKTINGEVVNGNSVYTDTYVKENGRWWCVQAHITPIKN